MRIQGAEQAYKGPSGAPFWRPFGLPGASPPPPVGRQIMHATWVRSVSFLKGGGGDAQSATVGGLAYGIEVGDRTGVPF